jgi:hypothetical protein
MIIALDYDETYTADKDLWDEFISQSVHRGHEVVLATYRHPVHDYNTDFDHLKNMAIKCYFTDGKAKKQFLEDLGVTVNVWIDDRPKTVYEDSAWGVDSPELHAWRKDNELTAKGEPRVHLDAIVNRIP